MRTRVGAAVVLEDLVGLMMLRHENDRRMRRFGETLVDACREVPHAHLVGAVFVDAHAGGCGDLDEREFPDPLGLQLEQSFHRAHPFLDPLGVIHPVDADADGVLGREVVALADHGAALLDRRAE